MVSLEIAAFFKQSLQIVGLTVDLIRGHLCVSSLNEPPDHP